MTVAQVEIAAVVDSATWRKLRRQVQRERQKVRATDGLSKDAKTVSAAQESAFTTVLWLMDRIEATREP